MLFYYMLPAFKGNLISPFMRVSIPKEYSHHFLKLLWSYNGIKEEELTPISISLSHIIYVLEFMNTTINYGQGVLPSHNLEEVRINKLS